MAAQAAEQQPRDAAGRFGSSRQAAPPDPEPQPPAQDAQDEFDNVSLQLALADVTPTPMFQLGMSLNSCAAGQGPQLTALKYVAEDLLTPSDQFRHLASLSAEGQGMGMSRSRLTSGRKVAAAAQVVAERFAHEKALHLLGIAFAKVCSSLYCA